MALSRDVHPLVVPVALIAALGFTAPAAAVEAPAKPAMTVSGELDVSSHYVWRGIAFSSGMVVNPSLTWAWKDLSLNAWANLDRDLHQPHALNEVDWTLGWSRSIAGIDLKPSAMIYTYPQTGVSSTAELQLEIGHALVGPLSTYTRQSVDVREFRGAAFSTGGLACELPAWRAFTVSAHGEYGRGWWRFAKAYASPQLEGLNVLNAGMSADVAMGGFTLRPHVDWYQVGNATVRDEITGSTPFVWGIALDGDF